MKKKLKGYYNIYGEFMSNRSMFLLNSAVVAGVLLVLTAFILDIANIDYSKSGLVCGYIYAGLVLVVFIGLVLMIKDKNKMEREELRSELAEKLEALNNEIFSRFIDKDN